MEIKEISPESLAQHMASLRQSEGWQILLHYMAQEREKIIEEGKASRANEKQVKMWAELSGYDKCATLPERLQRLSAVSSEGEEIED